MNQENKLKQEDQLLDSNYDGIQEYDNDLPRWWVILFYITIIYSVLYYIMIATGVFKSSEVELAQKLDQIVANKPLPPKNILDEDKLLALFQEPERIADGKTVYLDKCSACHMPEGQGLVGPNLTDDYWIHGGKLTDIRNIIEVGVVEKGMLSWKGVLSDDQITNVALYVHSLLGTNPPNPKAPEGDLYESNTISTDDSEDNFSE